MVAGGALVMVVAGGGALAAQIGLNMFNNAVQTEDLLGDQRSELAAGENVEGPLNFLVLGVDEQGDGRRSDSTILVHVNADLDEVAVISMPRDLLVDIESCDPACSTKLTEAFSAGDSRADGFANSAGAISDLTGVRWDGGMIVDFNGFLDLVDELGTIELCPWHEITSIHGDKKTYPEGCAEYDKKEALDLVRQRYGWDHPEDYENGTWGDYGRQAMQQQAVKAILTRAKELGYHTDPAKAVGLLNGFGEKLTVDLGGMNMVDLIVAMRDVDPETMASITVPSRAEDVNGTSYVVIGDEDAEAADALWAAIADDSLAEWIAAHPEHVSGGVVDDLVVE